MRRLITASRDIVDNSGDDDNEPSRDDDNENSDVDISIEVHI